VEQEIETGDFNESYIQVTKGLDSGQVICLNPPLDRNEKPAEEQKPQDTEKTEVAGTDSKKSDTAPDEKSSEKSETEKSASEKTTPAESKPQKTESAPAVSVAEKSDAK